MPTVVFLNIARAGDGAPPAVDGAPPAHPQRRTAPEGVEPLWREAVGAELRRERTRRGERIADVAGRAGVAAQYLSEIERGRKDPSSEVLSAVAGALGWRVADLTRQASRRLSTPIGSSPGPVCLAA